ncbi:MAG: DUF3450 family protein [Puniceicoccaceae bacterium]
MRSSLALISTPNRLWLLLLPFLGAAFLPALPTDPPVASDQAVQYFSRWIEIEQAIAAREVGWQNEKNNLTAEARFLEAELRHLDQAIASANAQRDQLLQKEALASTRTAANRDALTQLEGALNQWLSQVQSLAAVYPKPVAKELLPRLQRASQPSDPLVSRFQTASEVMAFLLETSFSASLHNELRRTTSEEVREFQTLYLGPGFAWFANADGSLAGFGASGQERWTWQLAPGHASEIVAAIQFYQEPNRPRLFYLPVPILDQ